MMAAPKGAVFIWLSNALEYPKRLAAKHGREDLKVVGPSWLESDKWRGLELYGIILDHAAELTEKQHDLLNIARTRVRL
jgi:hypothetical protein